MRTLPQTACPLFTRAPCPRTIQEKFRTKLKSTTSKMRLNAKPAIEVSPLNRLPVTKRTHIERQGDGSLAVVTESTTIKTGDFTRTIRTLVDQGRVLRIENCTKRTHGGRDLVVVRCFTRARGR